MKKLCAGLFALIYTLYPALSGSAQGTVEAQLSVDWEARQINLNADLILSGAEALSPRIRSTSEQIIREKLPDLLREKTADLPLNSSITVGDFTTTNPLFLQKLNDYAETGILRQSFLSPDLKKFHAVYTYDLSSLGAMFVTHTDPVRLPIQFVYEPTASFSGLVVYMKTDLTVVGERETEGPEKGMSKVSRLRPCLFPKIYDENMNLILERGMMKPDFVKRWGVVGYISGMDAPVERVGFTPLKILGRAIYGKKHTDIVIPADAARKLLASENNRRLLTEGRIIVICDLDGSIHNF